jgi:aspartokinase-like uncharacterized kinase
MKGLRVVKVGGSLLAYDRLVSALREWLSRQRPLATVLVAGGGPFADIIRAADARHGLGEVAAHWLCIEALSLTARLLATMLPEAELVAEGMVELQQRIQTHVEGNPSCASSVRPLLILDPQPFLRVEESRDGEPLPHTWSVTSDSIAARLAETHLAQELVLLKSAASPHLTRAAAAEAGYVDGHFPRAAANLTRVRWVDLRSFGPEEGFLH